ncbi:hypothetical protein Ae201684_010291 [Aphanomyces euteiches]|uniref:Uncharacterized protein n=1 Tax=Aphanomyces euteiches TaxID=100861 RepID=A0A6G0WYE9_9STRA|nr:hypothetical protein Ae201684_010291 [Aphanomyces euteiches]KAH9150378.1 hypothetical protein AeRB84_006758 [Aphanomyces euteiches]
MASRARCASNIPRVCTVAHHVLIDQFLEEVEAQPNRLGLAVGCSGSRDLYGALIVNEHIDGSFAVSAAAVNSTSVVLWPTRLCLFDIFAVMLVVRKVGVTERVWSCVSLSVILDAKMLRPFQS